MAIAPELRAQILRLYQAERWRIGTIASQLHLHRDTVQRVIAQACVMRPDPALRSSQIDPYLPFIRDTLAKFPSLAASRPNDQGFKHRPREDLAHLAQHASRHGWGFCPRTGPSGKYSACLDTRHSGVTSATWWSAAPSAR